MPMRLPHFLLALLVAVVWGFNFVVIEVGLGSFPPILFSALRFVVAALPLAFLLPRPKVAWRYVFGVGIFLGTIQFTLLFMAMDVGLPAGLASLVLQVQAFFTILLAAALLGERPGMLQLLGTAVAFCGIGLIALTVDGRFTALGLALAIGAALSWSVSNLIIRRAGKVDMLHLMVHASLIPPLPLLALSFAVEGWDRQYAAFVNLDWLGVGALLYIAFGATIFGFAVWGKLIRTYGAGQVAPFSLLVPIFGMSSSALVLGEAFGPMRIAAACLVLFGLMLTVIRKRAPAAIEAAPGGV
ncbi:EamA family transporter [Nitratireductor pacificus]|uniref:Cysteine and O-acetyl-L-serine efflux system n=1 Tax=Nitratireductor pacificus pht-3B TaxID=391937 RepID=K2M8E8_9HYPH|nr:EamA family transporter [Nitratireductor pacificus]EKF17225.1 cysteine and O-acetyl-L-serine efflux system [Nitratireductor pacificus pht-3B]